MCLGTWTACWTKCGVCPLSKPFIRQGQVGCGPRMWAIVVGHRKPWMSGGSHPPAQELCVAAMWRLQPRPKHAYCAGLKGHYNPSPYVPTPPSNLYSSLAVFASLQSGFNAVQCHAASHNLKRDGELSLSSCAVKTCASLHAAGLLSHPESVQTTLNQSLSLSLSVWSISHELLAKIEYKQEESETPISLQSWSKKIQSMTLRFRSCLLTNSWLFPHKMEVVFMLCFFCPPCFFSHSLPSLSLLPPGFLCDESQLCQGHLSLRWSLCWFIGTGSTSTLSWLWLLTVTSSSKTKPAEKKRKEYKKMLRSYIASNFGEQIWHVYFRLCLMVCNHSPFVLSRKWVEVFRGQLIHMLVLPL